MKAISYSGLRTLCFSVLTGFALLTQAHSPVLAVEDPEVISIGVIPFEEMQLTHEKFSGVVKEIEAATGKKVEWHFPTSYASLIEAQRRGFIHIGYYGPKSYIKAAEVSEGKIEAFAQAMWAGGAYREKKPGYHSYLIVKSDSPYKTLADVKGKTLALTGASSTSGSLVPKVEIGQELGVNINQHFGNIFYAGGHTASSLAVLEGKADVAAVADVTLDWSVDSNKFDAKTFRIIWKSSLLPLDPFAWRKDLLSDELKKKILNALLNLQNTENGRMFLEKTRSDSVERADDAAYDGVRKIEKELKKWE
ncbi:MAG: phosphate/phosphite/phosphonate ABC transporter substrate-binding protein [Rhodospirillales bacterium]